MKNRIHRTIVPRDSDQEAHPKLKHVRQVAALEFQGRNEVIDCVTDTEEEEVLDMISLEEIVDCPVENEVHGDANVRTPIVGERTKDGNISKPALTIVPSVATIKQTKNGKALGETDGQVSVMSTRQASKAFGTQGDASKGKTVTTSKNAGDDLRKPTVNTTHLETPNGRDVRATVFIAS